jgi:hypothetical protein
VDAGLVLAPHGPNEIRSVVDAGQRVGWGGDAGAGVIYPLDVVGLLANYQFAGPPGVGLYGNH